MRASGPYAALCALLALAGAFPASAFTLHPAVTVRASSVDFYAGHLVLDAVGGALLDDGTVHVSADRIVIDLSKNRYVAAGHVILSDARSDALPEAGAALGVDLDTHRGTLVVVDPSRTFAMSGASISLSPPPSTPGAEPLALVDLEGETPFARASAAVAHLGADVRLSSAHVVVPGGKDVFVPSYVYTFSSNVGYSQSNVSGSGEDIPIYFGSTRDSVSGAHFMYNAVTKIGVGLDHRVVDGDKAYDLFSVSPLNGPAKTANFTWQEQLNAHSSQFLNASSAGGVGARWSYDLTDSVHRSYVDLSGSSSHFANGETLVWQGAYEPLGAGWLGDLFDFHLHSEYGRSQYYLGGTPSIYHTGLEAVVQAPYLTLSPTSSLTLLADWRMTFDNQPHRQFATTYGATLQHQWNRFVTTSLSDDEIPVVDYYPSFAAGTRTYVSEQVGTVSYAHGDALAFQAALTHQAAASSPAGIRVQPWFATLDVRFRVSSSLALEIDRSYSFGYNGARYGAIGFQIFP